MTAPKSMPAPLPPPFDNDQRPVVALFRSPLFNASETFVPAQAMALRRYQPLILGLERKGNIPALLDRRILLLGRVEALKLKLFGRSAGAAARLRPYRSALLHAHFGTDGLLALPLACSLGLPLVTTLHGYDVGRRRSALLASGRLSWMRYALLEKRLMRSGTLFLAVSDALRRQAVARGYPAERTVTHRIGVDLSRFPPGAGGGNRILHVGRLVEKKGTHILLRAFAAARRRLPDAELVIVGDGPRRAGLERLAAELGLGSSARFLGALPPAEVAEWMRNATLLAAPSLTAADGDVEGLPVVLFEAAASGLPVVASDHGGLGEAVSQGLTGFVVPEGEAEPLAERMLAILASPDLAARMREASRRLAEEEFDIVAQTARLERLYDALREPGCA